MPSISRIAVVLVLAAGVLAARQASSAWVASSSLKAANAGSGDGFGGAIALSGTTLVVGAPGEDSLAYGVQAELPADEEARDSGAAYVYVWTNGAWVLQACLKASNTEASDNFGRSVAISGDVIVVGAPNEDSSATGVNGNGLDNGSANSGAAYVFRRSGTTWTQQAYLKGTKSLNGDLFGFSVGVSGDIVAVGAPMADEGGGTGVYSQDTGGVYAFKWSGSDWANPVLVGAGSWGDLFGYSVAISGTTVVTGGPWQQRGSYVGAAWVYVLQEDGTWDREGGLLKASDASNWAYFGCAVAISGDTIVATAPGTIPNGTMGVEGGAAYVYVRNAGVWTQQAKLKAPNAESDDRFGYGAIMPVKVHCGTVAISGDNIIVGAPGEDSAETGLGGNGADNGASNSGAAYAFHRTGTTWDVSGYLKASNTGADDAFGGAVAISGGVVVVGASGEDSTPEAGGVGGDDDLGNSGAVYRFRLPSVPNVPTALAQAGADGSPLAAGGSTHGRFYVRASVSDSAGLDVALQVEVKPAGVDFDGAVTGQGGYVASGAVASISVDGLAHGNYHWRVRTQNSDATSAWTPFSSGTDILIVNGTPAVTSALQVRGATGEAMGAGQGLYDTQELVFDVTAVDPDADTVRVELELRPVTESFRGVATFSGALKPSGTRVTFSIVPQVGAYHWRQRSLDAFGLASEWKGFGGNGEAEADFIVGPMGSLNSGCIGSAPGSLLLLALLLVPVALGVGSRS